MGRVVPWMNVEAVRRPLRALCLTLSMLLAVGVVGCERAPAPDRQAMPDDPPAAEPSPAAADPTLYPVEIESGISLAIRKTGSREYRMHGTTDRTSLLRLSVEDGHDILFGPVEIPVAEQRFRLDLAVEPTDRDHIFFYITDRAGARLAVIPVDTARELTTAGPAAPLTHD